ncbi:hypothetical protein [Loktanella sp. SALINAS62]|uniref:hypothetical protein n=1 Tax=Loktanella sp. SALINAS62 TaxID=2706124 RepID=UPI001B8BDAB7|nr:hypothetical protein [Loktanella sp. SALINAS62]MBS1301079.1 hypothetical protein [Loktanella sp. SALINAS62]
MKMTGLFNRLLRYIAQRGLRDAARLIPSESNRLEQPSRAKPAPDGQMRLHLFGANFEHEADAIGFCTQPPGTDLPSPLTVQLDGAFVDHAEVEVVHGAIKQRLDTFLEDEDTDDVLLRLAGDNTLIILTERAFCGMPFSLDDTQDLTYLGDIMVRV